MRPEVSILIPCYNSAPWLAAAIESAITQNVSSKEIIIVDDGSTDDSLKVAQRYESTEVIIRSQKNLGAASARNHALKIAQGHYIQYLDADDLLAADKIKHQLNRLQEESSHCVATCLWARFENDAQTYRIPEQSNFKDLHPIEFLQLNFEQNTMMHPASWLIPAPIAHEAGEWDESLSLNDDGEYFSRIALASGRLLFTPDALSLYRSNLSHSLSGKSDPESYFSLHKSIQLMTSYLLEAEDSPRSQHACALAYHQLAFTIFNSHPELATACEKQALQLAHSKLPTLGGTLTQWVSKLLGWKTALKFRQLRYTVKI